MFVQDLPPAARSEIYSERLTFTLTDAFVLLVACWFGTVPAIFPAGIEGFTSSRHTARRLSSDLFLVNDVIGCRRRSVSLSVVMHYGFAKIRHRTVIHSLLCARMLVASIVQIAINIGLFSMWYLLRQDNRALDVVRGFLWIVPTFLPNGAAATLMYYTLS